MAATTTLSISSGGPIGGRRAPMRAIGSAVVAVALALGSAGAANASSTITRGDLRGTTFVNPCTDEAFTITDGTFQLVTNATFDADGGLHLAVRGSAQGVVAVGATSGDMYRLAGDFWTEQTIRDASYPLTVQLVEVHHVLSAGPAPNLLVHVVRHLTVTAAGDVTANIDSVRAECLG